jgi:hypothetical protein
VRVIFHWALIGFRRAEEEQADEDKKTTRDVEAEKQKHKKRGHQDEKLQPPKNPKPPQKVS